MRRSGAVAAALLLLPSLASAVEPEACVVPDGSTPAASVVHAGRVYELTSAECRDLFLTDPERYAQLFDALAELAARPSRPRIQEPVSLVPN